MQNDNMESIKRRLRQSIKEDWDPHYEILTSQTEEGDTITAFFLMDTDREWELMQKAQTNGTAEEMAEMIEDMKEEILEAAGFDEKILEKMHTERDIAGINKRLKERIYEAEHEIEKIILGITD